MTRKTALFTGVATLAVITTATVGLAVRRDRSVHAEFATEQKPRQLPAVDLRPASLDDIAARRAAVVAHPSDADKLRALGEAQLSMQEWSGAAESFKKAVALKPDDANDWSALGEAYVHAVPSATPRMPELARQAFDKALSLQPGNIRARFYIALEKDFSGRHDDAVNDWLALLKEVPRASPPAVAIREAIMASMNRNIRLVSKAVEDASPVTAPSPVRTAPGKL